MKDCYYCEKGEKLNQLMTHIADMGNASIYLFVIRHIKENVL